MHAQQKGCQHAPTPTLPHLNMDFTYTVWTNFLPTLKPQQKNSPNQKTNPIKSPQCGVKFQSPTPTQREQKSTKKLPINFENTKSK